MKRLLPLCLALFLILSSSAPVPCCKNKGLKWLSGEWFGLGFQTNGSTWTIRLSVDEDAENFKIEYPSLECGGAFKLRKKHEHRAEFIESIDFGQSNCVNNGRLILTYVDDDHVSFTWYYEDGQMGAFSTLERMQK